MELQELMTIDPESLTARQAQQIVGDAIRVLSEGVSHQHQQPLRDLLLEAQQVAQGRKVGDNTDTLRTDVLARIEGAEARGDKRTARYLRESMVEHDAKMIAIEQHKSDDTVQKFIKNNLATEEADRQSKLNQEIERRAMELLRVSGSDFDYSLDKARQKAKKEVIGPPAYEDDIDGL